MDQIIMEPIPGNERDTMDEEDIGPPLFDEGFDFEDSDDEPDPADD